MSSAPITVLVVDDSPLVRRALVLVLQRDRRFRVVGEAGTGLEALLAAKSLRPQIVTMDIDMPGMGGLEAIEQIMAEAPTRILVVTGDACYTGPDAKFEALSRGALEVFPKPTIWPPANGQEAELLHSFALLSSVPVVPHVNALREQRQRRRREVASPVRAARVVLIGASTGGPRALRSICEALPRDYRAPVVIVQHLADAFGSGFIEWLRTLTPLPVREATRAQRLEAGTLYVAVRGPHVVLTGPDELGAFEAPPRAGHRPAIDVLFESAARSLGTGALAVLLTGMGRDGARGLRAIADAGGVTVAQDEATSAVFGMPRAAVEEGGAQRVLHLEAIATLLAEADRP